MRAKRKSSTSDMITAEEKTQGDVGFTDYKAYFSFSGGMCAIMTILLISVGSSLMQMLPPYILTEWSKKSEKEFFDDS